MEINNKSDVISAIEHISEYSKCAIRDIERVFDTEISDAFEAGFDAGINSIPELKELLWICNSWVHGRCDSGQITISDLSLVKAIKDFEEKKYE